MEGAPITDAEEGDSLSRKNYKSNFSIDSLLEKKLGNTSTNGHPPRPEASPVRPLSNEKPISLSAKPRQIPTPFATATSRFAALDSGLRPFLVPPPPNFGPLARWPFLHAPPPPPPNFSFAAVAPIWAMAAQAVAASGIVGPPGLPPFGPTGGNVMPAVDGGSSDGRRPVTLNKAPPVKKYKCDVCSKAFSRSNTLVTHKRIHSGEKPFACEHCGRAFRQPGNLTRHRLTHTTVKPYVCNQCGKAFNRASNLHTHMRTHTDYRPYICPFCAKAFHQKIDMKIHSYTHTGEKPFRCSTCHKGFTLSSTLNAHRRSHCNGSEDLSAKKQSLYSCEQCGKDFLQRSSLKNHILASHPCRGGDSRNIL